MNYNKINLMSEVKNWLKVAFLGVAILAFQGCAVQQAQPVAVHYEYVGCKVPLYYLTKLPLPERKVWTEENNKEELGLYIKEHKDVISELNLNIERARRAVLSCERTVNKLNKQNEK